MVNLTGRRDGGSEVDYTVNPQTGLPFMTGPGTRRPSITCCRPGISSPARCSPSACSPPNAIAACTAKGQLVRLALKDVALAALGHLGMIAEVTLGGEDRPRYGNYLYGAFGRDFETVTMARASWSSA